MRRAAVLASHLRLCGAMGACGGKDRPGTKDDAASSKPLAVTFKVKEVATVKHEGQKPGTSGLRKPTRTFMKEHYLENFVQSVFDALKADEGAWNAMKGKALVVSGDGRFHNKEACQVIIKMAIANGVSTLWVGEGALLSTPAVSAVIRCHGGGAGFGAFGGFILSASHNPGGIDKDFGIKYNCENGGPAPEKVTNAVHGLTEKIEKYHSCDGPNVDIVRHGKTTITVEGGSVASASVEVFDAATDHVELLKKQFDFPAIKKLVNHPKFTMKYDCMNGVQGPYAKRVFLQELGLKPDCLLHAESMEDFGGESSAHHGHADPNLTYAKGLVAAMGLTPSGKAAEGGGPYPVFGAAADGDADRNMICGSQFFISPSDSLAIIAEYAEDIPGLKGMKGCARSMPTSGALDLVAKEKKIECFETPTGWKFFGNLMDSGNPKYFPDTPKYEPFLCGEESFGTGSNHVREKDGMWAVLAWLQILAVRNKGKGKGDDLVTPEQVTREFWAKYGRAYYTRYDYEGVDKAKADAMMADMTAATEQGPEANSVEGFELKACDMFAYTDPIDGSVSKNQGIRWLMASGSRIIIRLSGTGTAGATIRVYLEAYTPADGDLGQHAPDVVTSLAQRAMALTKIPERFPELPELDGTPGVKKPTVIT